MWVPVILPIKLVARDLGLLSFDFGLLWVLLFWATWLSR